MTLRIAFIGLRHSHILDLYRRIQHLEAFAVVAACEEDPGARRQMAAAGIEVTHESADRFWAEVDCDVVAVADTYDRRGSTIAKALAQGKHVIADKPICISLAELDQIEAGIAQHGARLGCMLDLRDSAPFIGLRELVQGGEIGDVQAISFGGQHPLLLGTRPSWYFEPGRHGGVINDIAIHAVDAIPWIAGTGFAAVNSARCWQGFYRVDAHFADAGQMMLTLENGGGVLGDVSYFAPDSFGYTLPHYWRMTLWGEGGLAETSYTQQTITLALNGEQEMRQRPLPAGKPGGYLAAFLHDIQGTSAPGELTTAGILDASRTTLRIQEAADSGRCHVDLRR
jgi:predicted dehydrogenase